jgi:hypothetical protein
MSDFVHITRYLKILRSFDELFTHQYTVYNIFSTLAEFAVMAYSETPLWNDAWCRA